MFLRHQQFLLGAPGLLSGEFHAPPQLLGFGVRLFPTPRVETSQLQRLLSAFWPLFVSPEEGSFLSEPRIYIAPSEDANFLHETHAHLTHFLQCFDDVSVVPDCFRGGLLLFTI